MRPAGLQNQPKFWPIAIGAIGAVILWGVFPEVIKLEHVIFGYTAWMIILYTMATAAMQEEMVRQTELQLRPRIIGTSENGLFEMINVGHGTAVNIEITSVLLKEPSLEKQIGIHMRPPQIMRPNVPVPLPSWQPYSLETGKEVQRSPLITGCLVPKDAQFPTEITIKYDRVDLRHTYRSVIEISPAQVRLLKDERVQLR